VRVRLVGVPSSIENAFFSKVRYSLTGVGDLTLVSVVRCRHEEGRSRDLSEHAAFETSHDVLRYPEQGNPSDLQEVHARCKYSVPPVSTYPLPALQSGT
jgi:hypothetical protein